MFLEGLCYQLSGAQKNPDGGLRSCKVYYFSLLGLIILCYDCSFALAFFFFTRMSTWTKYVGSTLLEVKRLEIIKALWFLRTGGLLKQTVVMRAEVKTKGLAHAWQEP